MKRLAFLLMMFSLSIEARQTFDPAIPPPRSVLGYELGEKFSSHASIERYILALRDAAKNRVKIYPYGNTYEGRTLYLVVFSSAENLSRLDEIKSNIHKLSDPRTLPENDAEAIIKASPAIAWLSYGVHGNEASASEAALNVMYQLAARTDPEIDSILQRLVVVIDPLLNPDGHERYVNYEVTHSGSQPIEDKNAVENNEDSPSGRTNHYYFDLNRDWAWLTQRESQARIKAYQEWKPQVHVDFHEMGYNSSYFFFPAFKPINKNFPPSTVEWGELYGKANAAAFDRRGWSYWSGESFDLFYPGYGDSWPSLNGAIGMTYEQAGGGVGVSIRRTDETLLTLKDRLEHHSTTSMATLTATAEHREKRLRDFYRFFTSALEEGRNGPVRAYVVDPTHDAVRTAKMVSLLRRQGVEVKQSGASFTVKNAHTYFTRATTSREFPSGSFVISLDQPAKRLIVTLMEQEPALSDTFFYDISTWALPVAYGVPTYWTESPLDVPLTAIDEPAPPAGSIGEKKAVYAYLLRSESNESMRALAWLLQNDIKVNAAMRGFSIDGSRYPRGTIIIPVGSNGPDLHERMTKLAGRFHVAIEEARSGLTESGINLGSDRAVRLKKPRIIVAANSPVSAEAFGAIWSMFDVQYGIDFVPMKLAQIRNADLHDYTTMIFPDDNSNGAGYRSQLDSNAVQKIRSWIAGGGTFIGIEGGAAFASSSVGKIATTRIKEKNPGKKDTTGGKLSEEELEKRMTVEEKGRKQRLESIPGTILRVRIDPSHPLGFGYDTSLAVLKTSETMFELSDKGYNVGIYTKSPRLSGYISTENQKKLEETPYLVHEQFGSGNIILFADDPNFRLFWEGLNKLFLNSVLLMPSIHNVFLTADEERK